nr:DUF3077 domain-containing protein [Pseudomonas syringae]
MTCYSIRSVSDRRSTHSNLEEALNHAAELLQCAAVTAYESGDRLSGTDRHLAMSVMYLVEMAKTVIDQ